jgi:hypothetical protein
MQYTAASNQKLKAVCWRQVFIAQTHKGVRVYALLSESRAEVQRIK